MNRPPFALAGFYKRWSWRAEGLRRPDDIDAARADKELVAFVVVTTEPNKEMLPVQPKAMPLVLRESMWTEWLQGNAAEALGLQRRAENGVVEIASVGIGEDLLSEGRSDGGNSR